MAEKGLLSIIFPAWNERDMLEKAVAAAIEAFNFMVVIGQIAGYELIVVDDASTDGTAQIADRLAAADTRVRVVHHPVNRGLGGAIRTGLHAATGEYVLYMDSDMPCEFGEVHRALRILRQYEVGMVSAFRHDRTSEGPQRALYSFVWNGLCRWGLGLRIRDVNFSFKLMTADVAKLLRDTLRSEGSFIDVEMLVRARRSGTQILQIGVDFFPRTRGTSTLSSPRVIFKMLGEMVSLYRELRRVERRG